MQFKEDKDKLTPLTYKASLALVKYILDTQKISLSNINKITVYNIKDYMTIDLNTIIKNINSKNK